MADLDDELRSANPLTIRRSSPLSALAERELAELLAAPAEPAVAARRWALPAISFAAAASIAVVVAVVLAVTNIGQPGPASAAGPPILETTPLGDDLDDVLAQLAERARAQAVPLTPIQTVRMEAWSAQIEADAPTSSYYVQPEEIERTWAPDRSGSWLSRAGEIRYGMPAPKEHPLEPGTILRDDHYEPGQFPLFYLDAPPDDAVELEAYLRGAGGLGDRPESADFFGAIESMRIERTLNGQQTAGAIDLLAGLPDVTLAGMVTDRLGRAGVAIQTERASGTHRMLLIFSAETGLLLSSESIYLGGIPDFSLEYPTVINYYAWKD